MDSRINGLTATQLAAIEEYRKRLAFVLISIWK